jgi:thiol-disulfide isomerase/thioredoxin
MEFAISTNSNALSSKEFSSRTEFLSTITNNKEKVLLFKFTASWCKPCQKIKEEVTSLIRHLNNHVVCYELDVDENFDVYAFLKSKKMLTGIPSILVYYPGNTSYGSDLSVSGTDMDNYKNIFLQINNYKLNT